jgi:hypothetical protein
MQAFYCFLGSLILRDLRISTENFKSAIFKDPYFLCILSVGSGTILNSLIGLTYPPRSLSEPPKWQLVPKGQGAESRPNPIFGMDAAYPEGLLFLLTMNLGLSKGQVLHTLQARLQILCNPALYLQSMKICDR